MARRHRTVYRTSDKYKRKMWIQAGLVTALGLAIFPNVYKWIFDRTPTFSQPAQESN